MKKLIALVLALALLSVVPAALANEKITIAASTTPHAIILEYIKDDLAALGYDLEILEVTDYFIANPATAAGEVDANYFQHIPFLNAYNASAPENEQLVGAIGVHCEPYGIYPGTKKDLSEIAAGDKIAVTNDPSNETRALILLQDAGLIVLPDGVNADSGLTKEDIVDAKGIEIYEVNAEMIPSVLDDVAFAVINGNYPFAHSLQVARQADSGKSDDNDNQAKVIPGKILWIDSVHSFYTVCGFVDDFKRNFNVNSDNFRVMCLDDIGTFNERDETVHQHIIKAIRDFKPTLVVIDDLDHLTPECGMNLANNFYLAIRETLDHYDTSLLCVGYNLIGRAKATAGFIGKMLFPVANNVFRITNRGTTAHVRRVKGVSGDDQFEFAFTVNDQNFPQEVVMIPDNTTAEARFAEVTAVQDIFTSVLPAHEALTPDELLTRLNKRHDDMNRLNRNRHLIAGALAQGIIVRDANRRYTINNDRCSNSTLVKPDYDPLDDLIANIQKHNKIPNIPKGYPINSLITPRDSRIMISTDSRRFS